jgi:hypothetical protein
MKHGMKASALHDLGYEIFIKQAKIMNARKFKAQKRLCIFFRAEYMGLLTGIKCFNIKIYIFGISVLEIPVPLPDTNF